MRRNRSTLAALVAAVLLAAPAAFAQYSGNFINQEVEIISVDYENRTIDVRDTATGREYRARVEEKTKLKAKKKLVAGKKKPNLKDFEVGDRVKIKVYLGGREQELRELQLLRKAAPKT